MQMFFRLIFLFWLSLILGSGNVLGVLKLNQPLLLGGEVSSATFSTLTNTTRIVYLADPNSLNVNELFSVDYLHGPASITNLSGALVPLGTVSNFRVSPHGDRVVFLADKESNDVNELFSVPLLGGDIVKLNAPLGMNQDINSFLISPDSSKVVYRGDQVLIGSQEIFSVPITGGAFTKLNGLLIPGGSVQAGYLISPDSSRVVYRAIQEQLNVNDLYSVPIDGGATTKLNEALMPGKNVQSGFLISSNNSRVVYRANQDNINAIEIYSSQLTGGGNIKLNSPLVSGGGVVAGFKISPNGSRVVYVADQETDGTNEIYSSLIEGGGNVKLNNPLVLNGDVDVNFQISPDNLRVIYVADQDTDTVNEIYSALLEGGDNIKLNGPLVMGGDVQVNFANTEFQISPNSSNVVYRADQIVDGKFELFRASINGGSVTKLNGPLVNNGAVSGVGITISPDSSQVIYLADQETDGVVELYRSSLIGPINNKKINPPLVMGGNVDTIPLPQFETQSSYLFYVADQEVDNTFELYTAVVRPPVITSETNVMITIGDANFSYNITADNGPILGYGAEALPIWANLNSNIISGVPDSVGTYFITLFATNEAGFASAELILTVNPTNIIDTPPSKLVFNGDFDGNGAPDLIAQKKTLVTLIALGTNGSDVSKTLNLNKKDKVVGANLIQSNQAIIVQNKTSVRALLLNASNFSSAASLDLGSVGSQVKVVATGDINGDEQADIITQQGKAIGALLSPNYFFTALVTAKSAKPKVVAVLSRIGSTSNAVSSLLLSQGKKLFYYDLTTASPFVMGELQPGPTFDKAYKVVGAIAGTNLNTSKLILSSGKKVGLVSYGSTTLGTPVFKTNKKLGKVVAPQ